jgi:hypothetical protein
MRFFAKTVSAGKRKNWRRVFVFCALWWGRLDYLAMTFSRTFSFPPCPKYRLTLILALHCVPDAAGQKAVEPLYTEVYIKNW